MLNILKPVHEATPWINTFVLVGGKDKLGNLKLRICLDPTNLNEVIVREPYHFKTLSTLLICMQMHVSYMYVIGRRGIGTSSLMKLHPLLLQSIQSLEADDILIVGKKPNHSNQDQALTTLLETARRCNVQLNYEKLQYKKQEVDCGFLLVKPTLQAVPSLIRIRLQQLPRCLHLQTRSKCNPSLE